MKKIFEKNDKILLIVNSVLEIVLKLGAILGGIFSGLFLLGGEWAGFGISLGLTGFFLLFWVSWKITYGYFMDIKFIRNKLYGYEFYGYKIYMKGYEKPEDEKETRVKKDSY